MVRKILEEIVGKVADVSKLSSEELLELGNLSPEQQLMKLHELKVYRPPTLEDGLSRLDNLAKNIGQMSDWIDRRQSVEEVRKIKKFFSEDSSNLRDRIETVHAVCSLTDMFAIAIRNMVVDADRTDRASKARHARSVKAVTSIKVNEIIGLRGHARWLCQPKQRSPHAIATAITKDVNEDLSKDRLPELRTDAIRKRLIPMITSWTANQASN